MTRLEMKEIMQAALKNEYGFAPAICNIRLLEISIDGTYICAIVNGNIYKFSSYYMNGKTNGVWVGKGTIEKIED